MIDLTNGTFWINQEKDWELHPMCTYHECLNSPFIQENEAETKNEKSIHVKSIDIEGFHMSMDIHFGRNNYINRITLKSLTFSRDEEAYVLKTKTEHDRFIQQATALKIELNQPDQEQQIDADWGSINSSIDQSEEAEAKIVIRYRCWSESDKEKYLNLGKGYLHGHH